MRNVLHVRCVVVTTALAIAALAALFGGQDQTTRVLLQGPDVETVAAAVRAVGGEITHELGIINTVGARVTPTQLRRLEASDESLRIQADRTVGVSAMRDDDDDDEDHDDEKAWKQAEKRAERISKQWEKAAERAAKKAEKAAREAERQTDKAAKAQAKQAEHDAKLWEKTLKEWTKEWSKDAFLKGTKPTFFPGLVSAHALHDENVTGAGRDDRDR